MQLESVRKIEIPVPARAVWELIADFGEIESWWPEGGLDKVVNHGEGIGMVREIHTSFGMTLSEKLEALDAASMQLELTIVGDLPAGITNYRAVGRVRARGDGACELEWRGHYAVSDPEQEAPARAFIEGAYAAMFTGISDFMTRESRSA
jgi:hypothetical protein